MISSFTWGAIKQDSIKIITSGLQPVTMLSVKGFRAPIPMELEVINVIKDQTPFKGPMLQFSLTDTIH